MTITKRGLLQGAISTALCTSLPSAKGDAAFAIFEVQNPLPSLASWHTLPIGAGGAITKLKIANDGTAVIACDTYGAYIKAPGTASKWQQLITTTALPSGYAPIAGAIGDPGAYEIAIAPSNSQVLYLYFNGYVFNSQNGGASWTLTSFTQIAASSNANDRLYGPFMAVDPTNPAVCVAGTPTSGAFYTTNYGATWTRISTVADGSPPSSVAGNFVAYDTSVGGGQSLYIGSYGTGIYHSSTGPGGTFTLLNSTGMPTTIISMACAPSGKLWVVDDSGGNLHSYSAGAWAQNNPNAYGQHAVTTDASSNVYALSPGFGAPSHFVLSFSANGGATWQTAASGLANLSSADIPWMAAASTTSLPNGVGCTWTAIALAVDPTNGYLYAPNGIGVVYTANPQSTTTLQWVDQSAGIEQLQINELVCPTWGGVQLVAAWDRPFWCLTSQTNYPSAYFPAADYSNVTQGYSIDYAAGTTGFAVGVADSGYYSTNAQLGSGATWQALPHVPSNYNGSQGTQVSVSSSTNFIIAPGGNLLPSYTNDGGSTWNSISISGVAGGWTTSTWRRSIAADRTTTGHYAAYILDGTNPGIYTSVNGGASWTLAHAGRFDGGSGDDDFQATMKYMPGNAGYLFYTPGPKGPYATEYVLAFKYSTNNGVTWNSVPNIQNVWFFGFGAIAPGATFPSIYAVGWVSSTYGVWRSDNLGTSWTQIGDGTENGWFDMICTIDGDPSVVGQCYIGTGLNGGSGCKRYGV